MKKLLDAYKQLPTELRLLVAIMGLGTPAGIIYMIQRITGASRIEYVILGLLVVVGLVCLVSFLISRVFGLRAKRRSQRMAAEMTSDAGHGPVSMDLRASIKANNDKFANAIREMRKNLGVSIYDLPWYIVIGDSGCGKTKLINEGGLTFSTGKPEGYQLGTLNYNWWFTEDAIFIDMAGRLCNPQDDGDRREWTAFLDTVTKGRPGYPINGAIVCISAEHLLQDAPEKIEADANTVLERLRDLQSKCGVTFATYLVVTKCDKVLGFMQFFDRAERDITIKNQIFGWSKPGDFNELYDPEKFDQDFAQLYQRLSDLRMRRLADEAEEVELGLAYSYPEEFRAFREPLQIYVRTLFPMIRNPRGVKNLIFRGTYFTSATQQGGLILNHLVERQGAQAAESFMPLENLYPKPRPHFVKDLLFRKVFPEHGLVFRNEQQVLRNRKLAKLLWAGSGALGVLLFTAMAWSFAVINRPMNDAGAHAKQAGQMVSSVSVALKHLDLLGGDDTAVRSHPVAAGVITLGVGAEEPLTNLQVVRARLFRDGVLRPVLDKAGAVLAGNAPASQPAAGTQVPDIQVYIDGLEEYVLWLSFAGRKEFPAALSADGFGKLRKLAAVADRSLNEQNESITRHANDFFGNWRPADAADFGLQSKVAVRAIATLNTYYNGLAMLTPQHLDRVVANWMRIEENCAAAKDAFDAIVQAPRKMTREEDYKQYRASFLDGYGRLSDCQKQVLLWNDKPVRDLAPAIVAVRKQWVDCQARLAAAYGKGSAGDKTVTAAIDQLCDGGTLKIDGQDVSLARLDETLWHELKDKRLTDAASVDALLADGALLSRIREVDSVNAAVVKRDAGNLKANDLGRVLSYLDNVRKVLEPPVEVGETPKAWNKTVYDHLSLDSSASSQPSLDGVDAFWSNDVPRGFVDECLELAARARGTIILDQLLQKLEQVSRARWGLAEAYQGFEGSQPSYFDLYDTPVLPAANEASTPRRSNLVRDLPAPGEVGPGRGKAALAGTGSSRQLPAPGQIAPPANGPDAQPQPHASPAQGAPSLRPVCASPEFLNQVVSDAAYLLMCLDALKQEKRLYFTGSIGKVDAGQQQVKEACRKYFAGYLDAWQKAYGRFQVPRIGLRIDELNWRQLCDGLRDRDTQSPGNAVFDQRAALSELLQALAYPRLLWERGQSVEYNGQLDQLDALFARIVDDASAIPSFPSFARKAHKQWEAFRQDKATEYGITGQVQPWLWVSDQVHGACTQLVEAIMANSRLTDLSPASVADWKPNKGITWDRVQSLRRELGLSDEKITRGPADFESGAQALLNYELDMIYYRLQDSYARKADDWSRSSEWPYVQDDSNCTRTLNYTHFCDLLKDAKKLLDALRPLEEGLNGLTCQRGSFSKACNGWYGFLGLEAGETKELEVALHVDDPLSKDYGGKVDGIADTAHRWYKSLDIDIGLRFDQGSKVLNQDTRDVTDYKAFWTPQEGAVDQPMAITWIDRHNQALPEQVSVPGLGMKSPLAFFAFLRTGKAVPQSMSQRPRNTTWVVCPRADFAAVFREHNCETQLPSDWKDRAVMGKYYVGIKLYIKLPENRALPEPVVPMAQPDRMPPQAAAR